MRASCGALQLGALVDLSPVPAPPATTTMPSPSPAVGGDAAADGGTGMVDDAIGGEGGIGGSAGTEGGADGGEEEAEEPRSEGAFPGSPKPRLLWGIFYRQSVAVAPENNASAGAGRSAPRNLALCPTPDGSVHFGAAMDLAVEAHRRLWGDTTAGLFPEERAANTGEGGGGGDEDEDEMDALLRAPLPGQ